MTTLIKVTKFIICNYILFIINYIELILLCWTYFVRIFRNVSALTNNIELKADGNYLSEYNFQHY